MAKPPKTYEQLRALLNYCHETGRFTWIADGGPRARAGKLAGTVNGNGYREIKLGGKSYQEHRLAWLFVHGDWPQLDIDHINGVPTDNRIENLRDVSRSVNCQNKRKARSDNITGYLGVSPLRGRYVAQIWADGRNVKIGPFETVDAAHSAYLSAKREMHIGCTI